MFTHRSCIRWVYLFCKLYRLLMGSTRNFRVKVIGRHGVWPVCLPKRVIKYCNYADICCFSHLPIVRGTWVYISLYIYIHVTRTSVSHLNQSHGPCWATARFVRLAGLAGLADGDEETVGVQDGIRSRWWVFWPVDDFQRYHQHWYIHAPPWMTIPQLGPSINVAEWL